MGKRSHSYWNNHEPNFEHPKPNPPENLNPDPGPPSKLVAFLNDPPVSIPIPPLDSRPDPKFDFSTCPTRLDPKGPYFLPDVIEAIRVTHGNLYEISVLLGRTRTNVKNYIWGKLEAKDVYDEEREIFLDKIEQALSDVGLEDRDPATLRFFLSTLGKERGYAQKVEHATPDNKPLSIEVTLSEATKPAIKTEKLFDELLAQEIETEHTN